MTGGGAIKDPAHTGTSKGFVQAKRRGPIRKIRPNYANCNVTIQSHALSAGAQTHYATINEVRNGLSWGLLGVARGCSELLGAARSCSGLLGFYSFFPPKESLNGPAAIYSVLL